MKERTKIIIDGTINNSQVPTKWKLFTSLYVIPNMYSVKKNKTKKRIEQT